MASGEYGSCQLCAPPRRARRKRNAVFQGQVVVSAYLILLALPAWPNEIMRDLQTSFMAVRAGFK